MSVRRSNAIISQVNRTNSIPSKTTTSSQLPKRTEITNVVPPRKAKKEQEIKSTTQKIKVDYKSNNYYSKENYNNNEEERYIEYYDPNSKEHKSYQDNSDSYITVEQEDGNIKRVPNYYMEYNNRRNSPFNKKENYEYYDENSNDEENEEENEYFENEDEYEQDNEDEQQLPNNNYSKYDKYYMSKSNKDKNSDKIIQNLNPKAVNGPIHHQINFANDITRKGRTTGRLNNYGNNSTTTNNTYNHNVYYINPINVNNKKQAEESHKNKKTNNKKNSVYRNVDITINKRKPLKEKDFFKLNNIDKSKKKDYIDSAILIQTNFRRYYIKMKVSSALNLVISIKKGIIILEELFLQRKKIFWKKYKKYIYNFNNALMNFNIITQYLRNNRNNSTDKKYISFHKELGDSFNIINKRDNSEKKLKNKLNDVMKENTELKNQLVGNKNIEEKLKNLIDENKKNQNINAIIMKDNQQLAKKLKDFQDYRNTNLIVENQPSFDLTQKDLIEIDEMIKKNEIYRSKIKQLCLANIINKKIKDNKYLMKDIFDKYKIRVEILKSEEKEKNKMKKIYLKNLVNIIEYNLRLIKTNTFKKLFYASVLSQEEKNSKEKLKKEKLKNIFIKLNQNRKSILQKYFIKLYYNKTSLEKPKPEQKEENLKSKKLKKIFINYDTNRRYILKGFTEKWSLTSKILGMRAAARDKKKKRKLKQKNKKMISQKHFGLVNQSKNNLANKFCKSSHEFSYIVSNGTIIKESSSNEPTEINIKNNKCSISSDKINKKFNKNIGMKKINSVNDINSQSNIKKNINENIKEKANSNGEVSEEDSGDSLGLGNNSD